MVIRMYNISQKFMGWEEFAGKALTSSATDLFDGSKKAEYFHKNSGINIFSLTREQILHVIIGGLP